MPDAVTPKTALLAELESDIASYNGTYANVTTKAMRSGGFVMTGSATAKIVSGTTAVAVTVKRVVAKVEIQTTMTDTFRSKYGNGCVEIKKITLSKGAEKSYLIDQTTSKYATVSSSFTSAQDAYCDKTGASKPNAYKYNNLFYLNEKAAAAHGSDRRQDRTKRLLQSQCEARRTHRTGRDAGRDRRKLGCLVHAGCEFGTVAPLSPIIPGRCRG